MRGHWERNLPVMVEESICYFVPEIKWVIRILYIDEGVDPQLSFLNCVILNQWSWPTPLPYIVAWIQSDHDRCNLTVRPDSLKSFKLSRINLWYITINRWKYYKFWSSAEFLDCKDDVSVIKKKVKMLEELQESTTINDKPKLNLIYVS